MSYQREREEFLSAFAREFPNASAEVARLMLRNASAEQRYNEITSSIEVSEREAARLDKASTLRGRRMRKLCFDIGATLVEHGDPRGNPYLITTPSKRELSIPGRGLPASAFR